MKILIRDKVYWETGSIVLIDKYKFQKFAESNVLQNQESVKRKKVLFFVGVTTF